MLLVMDKTETGQNECAAMQEKIPRYLEGNLSLKEARRFTRHLKECDRCRDEIEIRYLVDEGLAKAERGETIDLHKDLDEMLGRTEEAIQRLTQFRTAVYLIESTAIFVLIACIIILYL